MKPSKKSTPYRKVVEVAGNDAILSSDNDDLGKAMIKTTGGELLRFSLRYSDKQFAKDFPIGSMVVIEQTNCFDKDMYGKEKDRIWKLVRPKDYESTGTQSD